jgi:uncharacterized protein (DUF1778 family)
MFQMTDDQYEAITEAAKERGQTPEDFFRAWVDAVRLRAAQETVDSDQAWFWTPEWQVMEAEADADIDAGRTLRFERVDDMFTALDAFAAEADA